MKNLTSLFVALMLFVSLNVLAQNEPSTDFAKEGTILFNPQLLNLGFSTLSLKAEGGSESTNLNQFGLAVSGGYAIQDNLFILGQVGAQSLKLEEMKFSFFSLGGGARYYLPNNFYAGAGLLLNNGKIKGAGGIDFEGEDVDSDLGTTLVDLRLEAGYSYFLLPSVALEPSVTYGMKIAGGKIDNYDADLKYSRFGINLGVSVFF